MDSITLVGVGASVLTSGSLIPQFIKLLKERNSDSISMVTLTVLLIGHGLWIWYGLLKKDWIIIASNAFAALVDMATFVMAQRFKRS
jgi:MtN3 and saliva related transmembrane protein